MVLVVVDGPLRESEHELLEQLGQMEKRVLICLNKSDWYSQEDRDKLTGQINRQTKDFIKKEDIVVIQAQPGERIRRRVLADGTTSRAAWLKRHAIKCNSRSTKRLGRSWTDTCGEQAESLRSAPSQ